MGLPASGIEPLLKNRLSGFFLGLLSLSLGLPYSSFFGVLDSRQVGV